MLRLICAPALWRVLIATEDRKVLPVRASSETRYSSVRDIKGKIKRNGWALVPLTSASQKKRAGQRAGCKKGTSFSSMLSKIK